MCRGQWYDPCNQVQDLFQDPRQGKKIDAKVKYFVMSWLKKG